MKQKLDNLLSEMQAIRILQVQLANSIKDKELINWKNIDSYIEEADNHWKKINDLHKELSIQNKEIEDIVSDEEIDKVWYLSDFGSTSKRDVIKFGVLKCACGYYQGSTSKRIITDLGLINEKYKLTDKGRRYLWLAFGSDIV